MAFMHGAQDGQKFMGVILLSLFLVNGESSGQAVQMPLWLMLLCSVIMGVGAVRRISAINFGVVKEMATAWILTFPGCGLVGFVMTKIFMAKADRFYYVNFNGAADCCCQAAYYLEECLKNYDYNNIKQMLEKMHRLEHEADLKKHEMTAALAKAFVTPLDREDMAVISQNIDEVADCIEEVLQRFYVDEIKVITPEAITIAEKIVKCCELMKEMLSELQNFKKPQKLHNMIIELSHMEEECDALYLEATLKARKHSNDPLEVMSWREIYDHLENCADACEHVGDSVEMIVMKNT